MRIESFISMRYSAPAGTQTERFCAVIQIPTSSGTYNNLRYSICQLDVRVIVAIDQMSGWMVAGRRR